MVKLTRTGTLALSLILTIALSLQVYYALHWVKGYDEAWNLFYAKVQPFFKMFLELKHNAHPPLASILLRIPAAIGGDIFWARLGSIIPSIIFIYFTFLILKKLRLRNPLPYVFTFILAISHTIVNLSVCVRAYTLMAMFIVVALYYYIDIVRDITGVKSSKIFLFVLFSLFAVWTEYSAAFLVVSLVCCYFVCVLFARYSLTIFISKILDNWYSVLLFLLGMIGIIWYFSWTTMPVWQGHVSNYYLQPQEKILEFIRNGISSNLRYFTPFSIESGSVLLIFAIGGVLITLFLAYRYLKDGTDTARASILLCHLLIWTILIVAGIKRVYPFGGSMRHQFVIFVFLLISSAIFVDECLRRFTTNTVVYFASISIALVALHTSASAFSGPPIGEFPSTPMFEAEYQGIAGLLHKDDTFYLTGFNHFAIYYQTYDWEWKLVKADSDMWYVYDVRNGNERMKIITDRTQWLPPIPIDEAFIQRISRIMQSEKVDRMWIFTALNGKEMSEKYNDQQWDGLKNNFIDRIKISKRFFWGNGYAYFVQLS